MLLAIRELRVDILHHRDHHPRHDLFHLFVAGAILDVAEIASAFIGQAEAGNETLHCRDKIGVVGKDLKVLAGSAFAFGLLLTR